MIFSELLFYSLRERRLLRKFRFKFNLYYFFFVSFFFYFTFALLSTMPFHLWCIAFARCWRFINKYFSFLFRQIYISILPLCIAIRRDGWKFSFIRVVQILSRLVSRICVYRKGSLGSYISSYRSQFTWRDKWISQINSISAERGLDARLCIFSACSRSILARIYTYYVLDVYKQTADLISSIFHLVYRNFTASCELRTRQQRNASRMNFCWRKFRFHTWPISVRRFALTFIFHPMNGKLFGVLCKALPAYSFQPFLFREPFVVTYFLVCVSL